MASRHGTGNGDQADGQENPMGALDESKRTIRVLLGLAFEPIVKK